MKNLKQLSALSFVTGALFLAVPASAATWQGGVGNWTDDNWGLDAPDGYPGDANYPNERGFITNSNSDVTVDSSVVGGASFDIDPRAGKLTIATGGLLSGRILESGSATGATIDITGGELAMNHSYRLGRYGDTAVNVSSGTLNFAAASGGGRYFAFRGGTNVSVNVSGSGAFQASAGGSFRVEDALNSSVNLSGSSTMNLTGSYNMNGTAAVAGLNHTIKITGSGVTANMGAVSAYATDADQSAIFEFILDGAGVSAITLASLDLSGGDHAADLIVDVSGFAGSSVDLFNYTTLTGAAFDSVTIIGGSGTVDYGSGTSDTITLNIIPEPASLALLGLGSLVMLSRRRVR